MKRNSIHCFEQLRIGDHVGKTWSEKLSQCVVIMIGAVKLHRKKTCIIERFAELLCDSPPLFWVVDAPVPVGGVIRLVLDRRVLWHPNVLHVAEVNKYLGVIPYKRILKFGLEVIRLAPLVAL